MTAVQRHEALPTTDDSPPRGMVSIEMQQQRHSNHEPPLDFGAAVGQRLSSGVSGGAPQGGATHPNKRGSASAPTRSATLQRVSVGSVCPRKAAKAAAPNSQRASMLIRKAEIKGLTSAGAQLPNGVDSSQVVSTWPYHRHKDYSKSPVAMRLCSPGIA